MHQLFTIWTELTESKEERHKHASKQKQQNATWYDAPPRSPASKKANTHSKILSVSTWINKHNKMDSKYHNSIQNNSDL